jgi:hypothetical protein
MKKLVTLAFLLFTFHTYSQSVFGYWYGNANVKTKNSANNYLVELVLQPAKGYVKGVLNYYFKNTYRSLQVKGNYDAATRQLNLYDIPITYYGSISKFEVDCIMNMRGTLRVAKAESKLTGAFVGRPDYRNTCVDIVFSLKQNADMSKTDSVLNAIRLYKETVQVWTPSAEDTIVAATVIQRKITNYVTEDQYKQRENEIVNEIEIESDSVEVSIYDNGEIDGDIISLFYNKQLILSNQQLTHKSIRIDLVLDTTKAYSEISMFAENLGLIAPNTALMIINDGKQTYNVPMSSNLQKNATIRIRRKKH